MKVDVFNYITEDVLFIKCKDKRQKLVVYLLKSLNKMERNYEIYNKEMLAVIQGLENQRHLLKGTKFKFKVWTDHKNLEYFMKAQKLNWRQDQQVLYLFRFDFTLKHVLGTKMGKVDRLSKRPDWKKEVEKDNENQVFIKDCWLYSLQKVVIEKLEVNVVEKIKRTRSKNKEVVRVVEEIKKVGVKVLREEEWQIEGELVLKEEKIYVLKDKKLRIEIIQLHHDVPTAGHGGRQKMTELVMRNYQWLGVTKNVRKYVDSCDMHQRMKNWTKALAGKLITNEVLEKI